jgi:hypothetical protein
MKFLEKNIYSQTGEDGIIEKIFEVTGAENRWCVEFGAWDGVYNSNTAHLIRDKGWSAVLIEGDKERADQLKSNYSGDAKVTCLQAIVDFEGDNSLQSLLGHTPVPRSFDLISIDVDGPDFHIWNSLKEYEPRVVVIEFNPTIPPNAEFVQPRDMRLSQGSSLLSIAELGKMKGYELVYATKLNGFFVKKELYARFGITDNSASVLQKSLECRMNVFQLYDGTLVVRGLQKFLWHDVGISSSNIQIIPRPFRMFPGNMGRIRSFLFKVWRKMHNFRAHR